MRPPVAVSWPVSDQVDGPVLGPGVVRPDGALAELDGQVALQRAVVDHVALDQLALVPEREHEAPEPVVRVVLHDVPEDRPPHRSRPSASASPPSPRDPATDPAREDRDPHRRDLAVEPRPVGCFPARSRSSASRLEDELAFARALLVVVDRDQLVGSSSESVPRAKSRSDVPLHWLSRFGALRPSSRSVPVHGAEGRCCSAPCPWCSARSSARCAGGEHDDATGRRDQPQLRLQLERAPRASAACACRSSPAARRPCGPTAFHS